MNKPYEWGVLDFDNSIRHLDNDTPYKLNFYNWDRYMTIYVVYYEIE